jgi:pilus assembly protein CpaB
LGSLSLLLRKAGDTTSPKSLRVSLKDLFDEVTTNLGAAAHSTTVITIKRGTAKEDYSVPIEGKERRASVESEQGQAIH